MQLVLSVAIGVVLLTSLIVLVRWGLVRFSGRSPTSLFTFVAILFTSGLDIGLIMLPITEFPVYEEEPLYQFANPLAVEFGFWAGLVWVFYFLTTFYFCVFEPKLKIFEIPAVKLINSGVIIATCAFSGFLFLSYLPQYIDGIPVALKYGIIALVVFLATASSTNIRYVKLLSLSSVWLFFCLVIGLFLLTDMGFSGLLHSASHLGEYFSNIHRFVFPLSDYHAFYLFWWFSWSIMIGQFVARFTGSLNTLQLFFALLVLPSIPIAIWFSVLYYYHTESIAISNGLNLALVGVGVVFLINSLDSLIRLYTEELNLSVERLGFVKYIAGNWLLLISLILLYQFTPLKIEWIGFAVIVIYALVYFFVFKRYKILFQLAR